MDVITKSYLDGFISALAKYAQARRATPQEEYDMLNLIKAEQQPGGVRTPLTPAEPLGRIWTPEEEEMLQRGAETGVFSGAARGDEGVRQEFRNRRQTYLAQQRQPRPSMFPQGLTSPAQRVAFMRQKREMGDYMRQNPQFEGTDVNQIVASRAGAQAAGGTLPQINLNPTRTSQLTGTPLPGRPARPELPALKGEVRQRQQYAASPHAAARAEWQTRAQPQAVAANSGYVPMSMRIQQTVAANQARKAAPVPAPTQVAAAPNPTNNSRTF